MALRRVIQSTKNFPRKKLRHDLDLDLEHGWLLPYLIAADMSLYGRWDYWYECMTSGNLPDTDIPQIDWVDAGEGVLARKMLEVCLDTIPGYGSWQGWGGWEYFNYFLDWLLYGFGHHGQRTLPIEPHGCDGASMRLYQLFVVEVMLAWPYDYFGDILAENRHGRDQGFFPTPMSVCQIMSMMTIGDADLRTRSVADCCVGTGRMILAGSNHSLRLYGQDINGTCIKATLVNGFLYAPWLVRPIPWLDREIIDPAKSHTISDVLTTIGSNSGPDAVAYLAGTEHDGETQWQFEPVKKRRRKNEPGEIVAYQGVLSVE